MSYFKNTLFLAVLYISGCSAAYAQLRAVSVQLPTLDQNEMVGRTTAGTGDQENLTAIQVRTLLNVEDGSTADQTTIAGITGTPAEFNSALTGDTFMFDLSDDTNPNLTGALQADGYSISRGTGTNLVLDGSGDAGANKVIAKVGDSGGFFEVSDGETTQFAVSHTGNVTLDGTVDGRDVLDDGQAGDNLITLSGNARDATNNGTFTGTTITDAVTTKVALQELETAIEGAAGGHDAVTLSGTGTYLTLVGQDIQVDPITESDISDLGAYITQVADDLTPDLAGNLTTSGNDISGESGYVRLVSDFEGSHGTLVKASGTGGEFKVVTGVGETVNFSVQAGTGTTYIAGNAELDQDVRFVEQTDHSSTPAAGFGYLWTKNTAPSTLIFTDDAGTDFTLGAAAGGGDAWSDPVDAVITPDADDTRDLGLTGTRFATGFFDNLDVTTNIVVGGTVDGVNIAAEETRLANTSGTNTGDQTIPVSGVDFDPVGTDNSDDNAANTLYASDYRLANFVSGTDYEPAKGVDDNFVTDAEKIVIGNTSNTNSGDQTSIVGITGTTAQFNTALTDGSFATGGGTATGSNTGDQNLADTVAEITDLDNDATTLTIGASATVAGSNTGDQDLVDETTPQLGANLDLNTKAFTGEYTAAVALADGDLVYMNSSGKMAKADADAEATTKGLMAMTTETISADATGTFVLMGNYTTTGLTTGSTYFVSLTLGEITTTAPSATGKQVRVVGFATSTTNLFVNPSSLWAEAE